MMEMESLRLWTILLLPPFLLVRLNVWWCRRQFVSPVDQRQAARRGALGMLRLLAVLGGLLLGIFYLLLYSPNEGALGDSLFQLLCEWLGMALAAALLAALPQILGGKIPPEPDSVGFTRAR
jgi:hypothetical protein